MLHVPDSDCFDVSGQARNPNPQPGSHPGRLAEVATVAVIWPAARHLVLGD